MVGYILAEIVNLVIQSFGDRVKMIAEPNAKAKNRRTTMF
jgi:hypothetical protein